MNRLAALRRRFIVVVMATITVMLLFIMLIIIAGNVQHYKNVAFESLHSLINFTNPVNTFSSDDPGAERFQDANRSDDQPLTVENADPGDTMPESDPPPSTSSRLDAEDQKAALALPGIVVALGEDGADAEVIFSRNMDTSDATVQKLVSAVLSAAESEGTLAEYDLSYSMRQTPEGTKIAFVDRSYETSNIRSLLLWSLLGFVAAWLAFLFLVWRLSSWVFRPVEEAWSQQRQFIADASHELKTPLAGIRLLTDSILQTEDMNADTTREFVEDIGREAQRLSRITEDLLRLTRLDSGIQDAAYPVSVSRVLERVVRMLGVVAREKEVTLTYETDEDAVVRATEDDIHQILYNLMENGIKYSGSMGFVHTTLKTVGDTVVISVEDNGIGIPNEDMEHIFERFYRVDKNRSRAVGGTGLGLSIVSDTVRRRGGSIRAQHRQSGSGTVFIVELPLARREEADE